MSILRNRSRKELATTTVGTKEVLDVNNVLGGGATATVIDDATSAITYIGKAALGSALADAVWQIQKIEVSGAVTRITWADANSEFDNVWNNRASLTYS
jgi:hypothetical protein